MFRFELMTANMNLVQLQFPVRVHLKQLVRGPRHFLALTDDNNVYSWGEGWGGELGHGANIDSVARPKRIESLLKYSIVKVAAGEGFSLFLTGNGIVLSCGRQSSSCLVQAADCWRPRLIDAFLKLNVIDIGSSDDHVVIVTDQGDALAWGRNTWGKLGRKLVGCPLDYVCPEPGLVTVAASGAVLPRFVKVFCGEDATGFVDDNQAVWLCGYNAYNKLSLNRSTFLGTRVVVEYKCQASRVNLKHKGKLKEIHLGRKHTVFLFDKSKVLTIGCNENAQLGGGQQHSSGRMRRPVVVDELRCLDIKKMSIGSVFTLAMSSKNVYFFGTRSKQQLAKSTTKAEVSVEANNRIVNELVIGNARGSLMDVVQEFGPDYPIIKTIEPKIVVQHIKDLHVLDSQDAVILNIQSILNLYSSKTFQVGDISLNSVYCFAKDNEVFVAIDLTTNAWLDRAKTQQSSNVFLPTETSNKPDDRLISQISSDVTTKHVSFCLETFFECCIYEIQFRAMAGSIHDTFHVNAVMSAEPTLRIWINSSPPSRSLLSICPIRPQTTAFCLSLIMARSAPAMKCCNCAKNCAPEYPFLTSSSISFTIFG